MQKFIKPLNMNGLSGRMLRMPAPAVMPVEKKREILLIYGHHASLERMFGIAESLNEYGAVTMPDFPGCGGMDSFYKIGMKPNIDTMADYLASFIKLRFRGKKITIAGMSLGFAIVTRMLQRYPELTEKVELLISVVGFSHVYDFTFTASRMFYYRHSSKFFRKKIPSMFFYNVLLHPSLIRLAYSRTHNAKKKMASLTKEEKTAAINFEVNLWRQDDVRTYMQMGYEMMTINNCRQQIDLPVHHISVKGDQYFDNTVVEQHMRIIFTDFTEHEAVLPSHAPSIIASKLDADPFIPQSIRKLLGQRT
jgi:pimeloyl-ACP methyl ester carboxylesterase